MHWVYFLNVFYFRRARRDSAEKTSKMRLNATRRRVRWDAAKKNWDEFLKMAKARQCLFNNHPTVRVDSASSLCASPLSLYANL